MKNRLLGMIPKAVDLIWMTGSTSMPIRPTGFHVRYPVHQDLLARRCDPPHAGGDRCAARTGRTRASAGWSRRPSRRWCGCIPRSTSVIPVASRRWRRVAVQPVDLARDRRVPRAMRAQTHETVIDTQGLLRSALIARFARGRRHGYDRDSVRERAASLVLRCASSRRSRAACDRAQPDADRRWRSATRRRARRTSGSTARRSTAGARDARRRPAARHRAAGEGMAGRALDRARAGARRERLRDRAAVGQRGRAAAQRRDRRRRAERDGAGAAAARCRSRA